MLRLYFCFLLFAFYFCLLPFAFAFLAPRHLGITVRMNPLFT